VRRGLLDPLVFLVQRVAWVPPVLLEFAAILVVQARLVRLEYRVLQYRQVLQVLQV
jgi:hypothetical protein